VELDQIVKKRVAKGVGAGLKHFGSSLMLFQSIGFTANISSESDNPGGPMSFFTPNNSVERPINILEQVQPVGGFPRTLLPAHRFICHLDLMRFG